jgi:hypothetical protein
MARLMVDFQPGAQCPFQASQAIRGQFDSLEKRDQFAPAIIWLERRHRRSMADERQDQIDVNAKDVGDEIA